MKILFNPIDGKIFYIIYNKDWFSFKHSTNIALIIIEIDEINSENKDICFDLVRTENKVDASGDNKYYMHDNAGEWELHLKDGWEEYMEDLIG